MVLRDFSGESRPIPVPTLAALVPSYHPGATQLLHAMTSKEAECPPIQMEPVDLSVNKKSSSPSLSPKLLGLAFPSPASSPSSSSCIDLRLHGSRHPHTTAPGDDTSSSADEHTPMSIDLIHRTGSSYLSLQRIKQASLIQFVWILDNVFQCTEAVLLKKLLYNFWNIKKHLEQI